MLQMRLVTLAPELPGALKVIAALSERGVVVAAGHLLASYAQAQAGLRAGITCGTHLFNGMPSLNHRASGLVGALLTEPRAKASLIVDGIHVHPAVVRLAWRLLGSERLMLVSDATAALGAEPGRYRLGGRTVTATGESVRLPDGTLAGSALSADAALRHLVAFTGCAPTEALPLSPARRHLS